METFECICKRTSVRAYTKESVPRNLLEKLVDAGRRAPTARGVEPWEFIVVTEKHTLESLSRLASPHGAFVGDASACIAVFCQDTKYFLEDGCAATQNILLSATDMGLGACWIAGDKKTYAEAVAHLLGVDSSLKLVSLISLGWPSQENIQRKKRALDSVLHWEKL